MADPEGVDKLQVVEDLRSAAGVRGALTDFRIDVSAALLVFVSLMGLLLLYFVHKYRVAGVMLFGAGAWRATWSTSSGCRERQCCPGRRQPEGDAPRLASSAIGDPAVRPPRSSSVHPQK